MTKSIPTPLAVTMNTPRGGRELKGVLGGLLPTVNDNVSTILCNPALQHPVWQPEVPAILTSVIQEAHVDFSA